MRQLVSVQKIVNIQQIEGCDNIELVQVLGWWCIVAKSENFKVGDLVAYFEIDSMIPEYMKETLQFMSRTNWRVRTIRMKGVYSQGIVVNLDTAYLLMVMYAGENKDTAKQLAEFKMNGSKFYEGQDLTEFLGVEKYEAPEGMKCGQSAGNFIENCPKTDETRAQTLSNEVFAKMKMLDTTWICSSKVDGSSSSFSIQDGEFKVCSHNLQIKKPEGDIKSDFWNVAIKYDIENKMREISEKYGLKDWSLQGELCGEGIQRNRQKFQGKTVRFFYIFDITNQTYLEHNVFKSIVEDMGLKTVPYFTEDFDISKYSVESLLEYVDTLKYPETNSENEGVVIYSAKNFNIPRLSKFGRISFKVVSNKYLLKEK